MRSNLEEYADYISHLLSPPPSENVVEWAEENVYVATGPKQGRFGTKEIPYSPEIINRFGEKDCKGVVLCIGAQSAKTTILMVGMLYRIARDPRDALWVTANTDLAKGFSKERWIPWVRKCGPVYDIVPKSAKGGEDKYRFGFLNQQYATMLLNFVGSNSPANLASRPVGILILDETDKYAAETKYEAAALDLVEERVKAYDFAFIAKASTPTVEGRVIWPEFLKTDQRYYFVPCPRCGEMIRLRFKVQTENHGDCGLRWWRESADESKTNGEWDMAKVAMNTFYKCQECGGEIYDHERPDMLEQGEWRATNPNAPKGVYGYHLSSLYSILSDATSLPSIAVKWLQASKSIQGRQNFINSWLAETWDMGKSVDESIIVHDDYSARDIRQSSVPIMWIDMQENHFWVVIRRFAPPSEEKPFGESWLLVADRIEQEEQLVELQKEYQVEGENVAMDMRHNPNAAGKIIVKNGWRGMMGVDSPKVFRHQVDNRWVERIYSEVFLRDPHMGTAWQNRTFERARYIKFNKSSGLDALASLRHFQPTIWHTHPNVHEKYQRHLNAFIKRQTINPRNNRTEIAWVALHSDDHLADCEVGCVVRAVMLGLVVLPGEIAAMT